MFLFRKFYDTAQESGGGDIAVAATETKAPLSFAEAMAQGGTRTTTDSPAAKPIVNKEVKEEANTVIEVKPDETSNELQTAAKANPESLSSKEEKEEVAQTQKETVTQAQSSWQEVLKSQQPDNVLKELGFDDKTVKVLNKLKGFDKIDFFDNLVEVWKSKGDVKEFLKELSTDYSRMASEEVMRHQLSIEYPKASAKQLDALYKKEIIEAYKLDSEDTDEVDEGKSLLDAKADKYRDTLTENQKKFLFPEPPEAKANTEPDEQAAKAKQEFEVYMSTVNKDPYAEKVFEKNQIVIGKGEDKFVYAVDSNEIKNILYDTEKWTETQFDKIKNSDGSFKYIPKVENQILTAAFAKNPQKFLDEYAKHLLSIGGKKAIEPINNAKHVDQPQVSNEVHQPSNLAEGMAKGGRKVTGVMQ